MPNAAIISVNAAPADPNRAKPGKAVENAVGNIIDTGKAGMAPADDFASLLAGPVQSDAVEIGMIQTGPLQTDNVSPEILSQIFEDNSSAVTNTPDKAELKKTPIEPIATPKPDIESALLDELAGKTPAQLLTHTLTQTTPQAPAPDKIVHKAPSLAQFAAAPFQAINPQAVGQKGQNTHQQNTDSETNDPFNAAKPGEPADLSNAALAKLAALKGPPHKSIFGQMVKQNALMNFGQTGQQNPLGGPKFEGLTLEGTDNQISGPYAKEGMAQAARVSGPMPIAPGIRAPVNLIAFNIAHHASLGTNKFQMRLDPPELGRVDIKLNMTSGGKVTAHLTAERPETLDLLQRDARLLEQALNEAGLSSDRDSLSFSLKQQSMAQEQADAGKTNIEKDTAKSEIIDNSTAGQILYARPGGVDIRI